MKVEVRVEVFGWSMAAAVHTHIEFSVCIGVVPTGEELEWDSAALGNLSWYLGMKLARTVEGLEVPVELLTDGAFVLIIQERKRDA